MEKQKFNLICILSVCIGVPNILIGVLNNPNSWLVILSIVFSVIGLALAFLGRINAYKTNTGGKSFALAGLIIGLMMLAGGIGFKAFDMLGRPTRFGISEELDNKMLILVIVNIVICAICAAIAVLYGVIAKKHK